MDLTATSESEGEPEPKYQRRYSPRRSDRSPSRRRSPGHRRDSPPPKRRSAYRDERVEPRTHSSRYDHHAATPTTPAWPWPTTPTLPRPGAPKPTRTASSRTSARIQGTARAGAGGAQRRHPKRRVAAPPLPPRRRPPPQGPAPGCVHPLLPPQGMGPVADAGPGHSPVRPTPLRPPHVPTHAGGGTLLPGVQRDGLLDPRRFVASGRRALRAGVCVSPHTVLPQGHAPNLPHPARAPPCCPPTIPAQPCLCRGHLPHPGQCPGAGSHISPPTPSKLGPRPASRPPCGRGPQANQAPSRRPPLLRSPPSRPPVAPPGHRDHKRTHVPAAQAARPGRPDTRIPVPTDSTRSTSWSPDRPAGAPPLVHHPSPRESGRGGRHPPLQGPGPDGDKSQRPPLWASPRHALHRGGRGPLPRQRIFPGRWGPRHPPGGPGLGIPLPPPQPGQGRCLDRGPERQLPLGPTPPSLSSHALRPHPAHAWGCAAYTPLHRPPRG